MGSSTGSDDKMKDLPCQDGASSDEVPPSPQKLTTSVHFETREVDENGVPVSAADDHTHLDSDDSSSEAESGECSRWI